MMNNPPVVSTAAPVVVRALTRQSVPYTPIWLMRQAGRYLPEYRSLRAKAGNFLSMCQDPDIACEITLQPLRRFALDAAIIFTDILVVPDAMGCPVEFSEGQGPCFNQPIQTLADIKQLRGDTALDHLNYVFEAIQQVRVALPAQQALIGFAGSPWTLAAYMIEGSGSKDFLVARSWIYKNPSMLHQLLARLTQVIIEYLNQQIISGADVIMLFDTWGGLLSSEQYQLISLAYMRQIIAGLRRQQADRYVPVIVFTKHGGQWLNAIATTGCDAISLDWTTDVATARSMVGSRVALQGHLDPATLLGTRQALEVAVRQVLADYGDGSGHVFNLGHGIDRHTSVEQVQYLIELVKDHSRKYHLDEIDARS